MYDGSTRSLISNPIDRHLVSLSMLRTMKTNARWLTIYIQHNSPGFGRRANWLPAPNGQIVRRQMI
jgi:hypothetical protein